jgi:outer membrane protein
MFNSTKYIIAVLILTVSFANAQQRITGNLLTLQQCLDIAVNNNLNVKQAGTALMTDSINFKQSKENLLPSLTGSASRALNQGRGINPITNTYINQSFTNDGYGLNAGVSLFNGMALQNSIKKASLSYQAGRMDFQAAKDAVTVSIITAIYLYWMHRNH